MASVHCVSELAALAGRTLTVPSLTTATGYHGVGLALEDGNLQSSASFAAEFD